MCTVIVLRRPDHSWPLLFAANRDEMADRPWKPPGRHWPERKEIVGGQDELAGGSWLGLNDHGVLAGVLNRPGTLGPIPGLRSRGELVLEALDHADAIAAVAAMRDLDSRAYRAFNLVVADNRDAFWIRSLGRAGPIRPTVAEIPPGLSMITAHDRDDPESARIRFHRPRFAAAKTPDPEKGDWTAWERLMASRESEPGAGPHGAMTIITETGFVTTNSSLIALPAPGSGRKPLWRFGRGHPDAIRYEPVSL